MRAKLTLLTTGISLLALLVLAPSVHAQAPPFLLQWGSPGTGSGQFAGPVAVAVDAAGSVYVADQNNGLLQKFTASGAFVTQWPTGGNFPVGVAVDPGGNIYVANISIVRRYTSDGVLLAEWTTDVVGLNGAWAVAVDAAGDVYTVDIGNNGIQKFTADGTLITRWGSFGTGDGQFAYPTGIAVDANGMVYVVDNSNRRIEKFTSSGDFVAKWGTIGVGPGQFQSPNCVAVDAAGNVYVTDGLRTRILAFTNTGTFITEWGGLGTGPGEFDRPGGAAADDNGDVYVADANNNRIQKFGPLPTAAKATSWGRLKRMFR